MKKLSMIMLLMVVLFSCAKKMTSTKAVAKPRAKEEVVVALANEDKKVASKLTPTASVSGETKSTETTEDLKKKDLVAEGKGVYELKCSRCHELKEPSSYNAEKWIKIVDWMGPRAKIDATEKESILTYVSFNAKK